MIGHILVVDDDEDLRESIRELLHDQGYVTVGVENGVAALDHLSEGHRPKLILLDLMLPLLDGWGFRQAQLADPSYATVPVFVLTANRNFEGKPLEVQAVVLKPFDIDTLIALIESL